ncbi:MAG TPA: DUF86 domain-containing protein [Thermoanaerobaculales bacterium]|nr:DUF86 domain-containing protein [Thermoanaerobaculales bacterium]HQL29982.1 DUF86 domain-containing protein [Thermoanaerobaculales bacterium]HQN96841.1 DUF86 domain-containing protein [Thermoanaerobaculales bacterium]HQP44469.1 DUF86 domain-containing protein [Thermoanaerobaculales bacterium]
MTMGPGQIDVLIIRRHLAALRASLQVLAAHRGLSLDELDANTEARWIVERGLQLCAQNVLDIATHIAAGRGRDVPDYASAIDELGRLGVLDRRFASGFRSVAGFRNVVVHGYLDIELEILTALLNERLRDFESFAAQVEAYLDTL